MYDQGGLVLILPAEKGDGVEIGGIEKTSKWLKTGVEFVEGKTWVSTVGCDRWADWSLSSAGIVAALREAGDDKTKTLTLELERNQDLGTLYVYAVLEDGSMVPLRENTYALLFLSVLIRPYSQLYFSTLFVILFIDFFSLCLCFG